MVLLLPNSNIFSTQKVTGWQASSAAPSWYLSSLQCSNARDLERLSSSNTTIVIMSYQALAVDEILREITVHATNIHPPTTISLACCARSFEEPALSALWRIQDEIPTLIKTLPSDSWEILPLGPCRESRIVRDSSRIFSLVRRFSTYARFGYRPSLESRRRMSGSGSKNTRLG